MVLESTLGTYLAVASTAASAYATFDQAQKQNKAIEKSFASQQRAASIQRNQLEATADNEKTKRRQRTEQIQGRLRVAGGEAGIGLGGSIDALARQADTDLIRNNAIIDQNLANQLGLVNSGEQANLARLQGQAQNSLLAGFAGGVQGFSTGLSIGGAVDSIIKLSQTTKDEPFQQTKKLELTPSATVTPGG